jgi:hypothetical protein
MYSRDQTAWSNRRYKSPVLEACHVYNTYESPAEGLLAYASKDPWYSPRRGNHDIARGEESTARDSPRRGIVRGEELAT